MVLQALGQHQLHAVGDLRDQRRVSGVGFRCLEGVANGDDAAVDTPHQVDQQAQRRYDYQDHDEAEDDRNRPRGVLARRNGKCVHAQPPSRARPRCRPPMMVTAYSMVVRSAPRGAVLRTAPVSPALIFGASSPIERASSRIGTTSATTTATSTPPMTNPRVQPK